MEHPASKRRQERRASGDLVDNYKKCTNLSYRIDSYKYDKKLFAHHGNCVHTSYLDFLFNVKTTD